MAVALEIGPKRRVFAQAQDWPGWCRAGKDEATALTQLFSVRSRYAQVAERAGLPFAAPTSIEQFVVVERVPGTAVTDFGALSTLFASDLEPLAEPDIERFARLIAACWSTFDEALQRVPTDSLDVKPQRGRSPSAIRLHLLEADLMHLSAFGPAFKQPFPVQVAEQERVTREQFLVHLRETPRNEIAIPRRRYGFAWTPRFAVRRSAWHALDHAWELLER
jgi:hypothetical protein